MNANERERDPAPPGVQVSTAGNQVVIRGGLRSGTAAVATILGGAVGIGLLFVLFSPRPEAIHPAAPFLLVGAAVALIFWVTMRLLQSEQLRVGDHEILYEKRLAGWCWRRRTTARDGHVDVRVEPRGRMRGVAIGGGEERWVVGGGLDAAGREWVREWVAVKVSKPSP